MLSQIKCDYLFNSRKLNQSDVEIIVKIERNFDDPRRQMMSRNSYISKSPAS